MLNKTPGLSQPPSTYLQNGISIGVSDAQGLYGKGVSVPPISNYTIVPRTAVDGYIVSAGAACTAGVPLILNQANLTMYNGELVIVLDCARTLAIFASGAITNTTTFTITGYDVNFKRLTSSITLNAGLTSIGSLSAFLMVSSITPSATNAQTIMVRETATVFGLPYFLRSRGDIISVSWDNVALALTTVTAGHDWRATGVVNASSADAYGLVSASTAANNARPLRISYYSQGADPLLNAKISNQVQGTFPDVITVYSTGARFQVSTTSTSSAGIRRNNSNTQYVYPTLIKEDLVAPRFPADSEFLARYAAALAT